MSWSEPLITVLITAIAGAGVGEQVLKALRLVGGYRIVGADVTAFGVNFGLVDAACTLPPASDPTYLDAVLAVCRAEGVQAVFPGCEPELRVLSAHRAALDDLGVLLPAPPAAVVDVCMDKVATARFLDEHGFARPRWWVLDELDELEAVDVFPVVVKPAVGGGGSADCHLAQDARELGLLRELLCPGGRSMMVQEYVGRPDEEYTVGVLHDLDGVHLSSIALRRSTGSAIDTRLRVPNRTGRTELGDELVISSGFSHGRIVGDRAVIGPCEAIATALGAAGPLNVQCRLVDGVVQVFEINPRLSGTTSLRAMAGCNEPDLLLRRHLRGEVLPPPTIADGMWIQRSLREDVVPSVPVRSWRELVASVPAPSSTHTPIAIGGA